MLRAHRPTTEQAPDALLCTRSATPLTTHRLVGAEPQLELQHPDESPAPPPTRPAPRLRGHEEQHPHHERNPAVAVPESGDEQCGAERVLRGEPRVEGALHARLPVPESEPPVLAEEGAKIPARVPPHARLRLEM